ncbi:regulatory protein GemA [Agrobacterium vitis]|uniref:regulatory protein GemA n=1 Tax=Allorhizobium ampelinum TaxID=3025782 RepID=UPI001F172102|nr:regulatory protein GemA [Allorhizobium ampelinum]MCF1449969.1 regulatory protein GemA [Allorhizobium ampelinum]
MTSSIAAIHVAKKQLGLDEDTYRAKLEKITGKASVKVMTEAERQTVLKVFRNEGFAPAPAGAGKRKPLTGKFAKKLQALWIAGWNLGLVSDRDDSALLSFVKGRTGLEHVRFLYKAGDATRAIEALKGWLARDGGVDWNVSGLHTDSYLRQAGYKIARAQWTIICTAGGNDFWPVVTDLGGHDSSKRHFSDEEWIHVMNYFGEQIRKRKQMASLGDS